MDLRVTIGPVVLQSPVCVASGTFGYGSEYENLVDFSVIGGLFTKAVTLKPRMGNDVPRIIETPSGLLNAIGLANVGVERFIDEKMEYLCGAQTAVFPNVAGSTEDEYIAVIEKLESVSAIAGYEINISCPNVSCGGIAFGTNPRGVETLTRRIRSATKRALVIKLTPNVTDITTIATAAQNGGADALSCINTLIGMVIDTRLKKPVLANGTGGLSGPAIRPIGVAMTYRVKRVVTIPIIGIGGIMCSDDAIQYLLAGASAVQIGTANFVDPQTCRHVYEGIVDYGRREKLHSIKDFHHFLHGGSNQ
ncbi:MAG: dihydroorotate dehydrogenase [Chitinivibrionales bacterium]|nr:dihydroorotate dehydrogenase [Chitinivibrionales bacterium]